VCSGSVFVVRLIENFVKTMAESAGKVSHSLMEFTSESKSKEEYFPCVIFVYLCRCCSDVSRANIPRDRLALLDRLFFFVGGGKKSG